MAPAPVPTPPRHAWEWFGRQRLLWREVRRDLAAMDPPVGPRYTLVDARTDVMANLRSDYVVDDQVRRCVHARIDSEVFLGHAHRGLEGLGIRNAPRGLRWWWATITGTPQQSPVPQPDARSQRQLALDLAAPDPERTIDDVHTGWGD